MHVELAIFAVCKPHALSGNFALQLYTPEQYAAGLVQAYPYTPPHKESLELLAAQQGQPSIQELRDEILDDAQRAANWDAVVEYLSTLTLEHRQHYNPLQC